MEETKTLESSSVRDVLAEVADRELDREAFRRLAAAAFRSAKSRDELDKLVRNWDKTVGSKEVNQVLQGYCVAMTRDFEAAAEILRAVKRNPWGAYYLAKTLEGLERPEEALDAAQDGAGKHSDVLELSYLVVELSSRLGKTTEAGKIIDKLRKKQDRTPEFLFHEGYWLERSGEYASALDRYRDTIRLDGTHADAFFRIGYLTELHGTEADELNDEAVSAYESCVKLVPVHTRAVTNLGLLYEDRERYHDAIKCYETVLRAFPNDQRARLYLRDARACTRMFYDREQEKKADKQSQVLRIPVSDFELSVRSRNCLQKMNIQTLGDLIMKTEQELLSYKNFGETSLAEIKEMLSQKGLRLGQGLDTKGGDSAGGRNPLEATAPPEVLDQPIEELNLSVRSRRCMERLEVRSIRDLINKTEVELMSAKNFGMTSLNEIKRKLADLGLALRS